MQAAGAALTEEVCTVRRWCAKASSSDPLLIHSAGRGSRPRPAASGKRGNVTRAVKCCRPGHSTGSRTGSCQPTSAAQSHGTPLQMHALAPGFSCSSPTIQEDKVQAERGEWRRVCIVCTPVTALLEQRSRLSHKPGGARARLRPSCFVGICQGSFLPKRLGSVELAAVHKDELRR